MMCLQYYDLEHEIINAKPAELEEPTEVQVKRTKNLYTVNEPQARAIISAIKNTGFTLIQGYVVAFITTLNILILNSCIVHLVQGKLKLLSGLLELY
jgi:hypothetical protein